MDNICFALEVAVNIRKIFSKILALNCEFACVKYMECTCLELFNSLVKSLNSAFCTSVKVNTGNYNRVCRGRSGCCACL